MVDNSQGHCAYAEDALLVSHMNLRPGGKQACMSNGWYIRDNTKVVQTMIFPSDHPDFPDQPKGMRQVLIERGLWNTKLRMECKTCPENATACCAKRILELQPDSCLNDHSCKRLLKNWDISASFSQNFTVSSISLNASGEPSNVIFVTIAITPFRPYANSIGSCQQITHSEMAQPNDAVDGCLQRWFECKGCPVARAGLQFEEIYLPSSCVRACCCCF
jgi:hypothetical protein